MIMNHFFSLLWQGWVHRHLKIWGWIFGMGRQQHTGAVPQMPPQGSVTMLKWQSMSECLYIFFLFFYLLPSWNESCLHLFCIIEETLLTLIPLHVFSAHRYTEEWRKVDYCTGITHTYCDLSSLIHEYNIGYKVKVQLVVGKDASTWRKKKFLLNTSRCGEKSVPKTLKRWLVELLLFILPIIYLAGKLRPPIFTLIPTSSSLTVLVHQKPILFKLFPFGVIYKVYLEQRGEDKKVIINSVGGHMRQTSTKDDSL